MDDTPQQDIKFQFDLRQRRANLIAYAMEKAYISMCSDEFIECKNDIENWFMVSLHAIKKKDKKKAREDYILLRGKVEECILKFPDVWNGNKANAEGIENFRNAFRNLYNLIMDMIEESGLFGSINSELHL